MRGSEAPRVRSGLSIPIEVPTLAWYWKKRTEPNFNLMRTRILLFGAAFCGSLAVNAQSPQLSLGVDLAMPLGDFSDFASFGVGPAAGIEFPVGDNIGVTVQVAYDFLTPNSDWKDFVESMSMLPAQAGIKYYFMDQQEGFYAHGQLGIHSMSTKSKEVDLGPLGAAGGETTTNTNFSWAIGAGYQLEKLDIGLRYNSISPDSDAPDGTNAFSYIGLRIGYLINLGG